MSGIVLSSLLFDVYCLSFLNKPDTERVEFLEIYHLLFSVTNSLSVS
jgi:hypothetical protein